MHARFIGNLLVNYIPFLCDVMGAILLEEYKVGGQGISRGHIKLSLIEIASLFHQINTPLIK